VQFVSISVTVAQLDLVLVLIATDLAVSAYTTHVFLCAKPAAPPERTLEREMQWDPAARDICPLCADPPPEPAPRDIRPLCASPAPCWAVDRP